MRTAVLILSVICLACFLPCKTSAYMEDLYLEDEGSGDASNTTLKLSPPREGSGDKGDGVWLDAEDEYEDYGEDYYDYNYPYEYKEETSTHTEGSATIPSIFEDSELDLEEEKCLQPKLVGECRAAIPRYYFNTNTEMCEEFLWGGCGGNSNNFETYSQCIQECSPHDPIIKPDRGITHPKHQEEEEEHTFTENKEIYLDSQETVPEEIPTAKTPIDTQTEMDKDGQISMISKSSDTEVSIFAQPPMLAAYFGGAVLGLLCIILIVMWIVYRMRKRDEGSYPLDEAKRLPLTSSYSPNDKEIYA